MRLGLGLYACKGREPDYLIQLSPTQYFVSLSVYLLFTCLFTYLFTCSCLPLQKVVELHKAEQRWIPAKERAKKCEVTEEEKATIEIYGKFQGILNKLTPQKFQALAEQALQLEINTEDRLKGIIDKIFTKVGPL